MQHIEEKRSWVEIDFHKLYNNLQIYMTNMSDDCNIMAVVKADAYGHGDAEIAKFLFNHGVAFFAVSNIDEAIHIRCAGVGGQILVLGYTPVKRAEDLIRFNIIQALLSEEYARKLIETNLPIRCQFAIDTGMRRIGLNGDNPSECERIIRECAEKIQLNGLFTHLCSADSPKDYLFTNRQIELFENIVSRVSDLKLSYCHCMNSAGGLWFHSEKSCITRLGIILYGLKPSYENKLPTGIEPILSWKSVVSMVKYVKPGDTIGYGRSFFVGKSMKIATIPTGYADGYCRLLSEKGWVLINGQKAPIVGRICMDQMMVDVTNIADVELGTEVVLVGKSKNECVSADDLAELMNTIGYEIICGISKRVERVYLGDESVV